jgi:ribosome-associated protein
VATEPDGDELVVTRSVRVPRSELDVRFTTSGGPGGQHANRTASRVELRLDAETSSAFSDAQRAQVIERLGPVVRVVADDERSQIRNRAIAEERLVARLASALHVERPRRPTRPSRGAVERRIAGKKRRSETKKQRRRPFDQ